MPSDKEYKATKQIMLGKETMNPDFKKLADFIDQTFRVKTINIIYDTIDNGERPRLNICFEFESEKQRFNENNGHFNFDSKKQKAIAEKFRQIIKENGQTGKYKTANVLVYYSAFEPIARIEANECVPQEALVQLKKELNNNDIWEISRAFSGTTFFVYTDEQLKLYENSGTRKLWADKYFDLLEPYNGFGYFERDSFIVSLDSKENFDKNYQGNWYYYYK